MYKNKSKQIVLDWYERTEPHTITYQNPCSISLNYLGHSGCDLYHLLLHSQATLCVKNEHSPL